MAIVLIIGPIASCNVPTSEITFSNLESGPETYADKVITIDGYWFDGFEIAVLAERLEADDFAPGNLKPRGILIWIKGGLSEEVREHLYPQTENVTGYPAHYGKVRLEGKLEYGGNYGHLNSYRFQLELSFLWVLLLFHPLWDYILSPCYFCLSTEVLLLCSGD